MATTLADLARLVDGTICGDGSIEITGAGVLVTARPTEISLVDGPDRIREASESEAAAVVTAHGVSLDDKPTIAVDDVHAAFTRIVSHFCPPRQVQRIGVSAAAFVSPTAKLGTDVDVHPGAQIGDDVVIGDRATIHAGVKIATGCRIAEDVTIFPNAVLYENTCVGPRSIIHANAVLGAYGFGYDTRDGKHCLSAQLGFVEIAADVEIGAGSTIDRGTYGPTTIGEGTKIDNMVQIAHNCRIGRHNLICSQVGIAGSSSTGDYVVLGGQVGVRDHVHIGQAAMLGAMSGVSNNIPAAENWLGVPATPVREQRHKQGALSKLPEMRKQLRKLQKTVDQLVQDSHRSSGESDNPPVAA